MNAPQYLGRWFGGTVGMGPRNAWAAKRSWDSWSFEGVGGKEVLVFASCNSPHRVCDGLGSPTKEGWKQLLLLQTGGRKVKEHRLHLRNKTVIQQWHIEGTTHAYDIFSPKQLKFGSGGGSNRLKGKGVRDRQLTENWGLCLFLISEARGQCQRSQALRPLLTSSWHLNCEFCLLLMMLLIS